MGVNVLTRCWTVIHALGFKQVETTRNAFQQSNKRMVSINSVSTTLTELSEKNLGQ